MHSQLIVGGRLPIAALYKAYDAHGAPLYIGITKNWPRRWKEHAMFSPWFYDVARLEVAWYHSRVEAMAQEARAIHDERPRYNAAGVPR